MISRKKEFLYVTSEKHIGTFKGESGRDICIEELCVQESNVL